MKKITILLSAAVLCSCSVNRMAVKSVSGIIDQGMVAVFSEKDLAYSKQALPANLKLMEILLETQEDERLLLNASLGFCGYAWAFLDESSPSQAAAFYRKGIDYSNRLMKKQKLFKNSELAESRINSKNAGALFWNTFCKSALINLDPSDSENSIMLGETEHQAMILAQRQPEYFHNAVFAIIGSIYASKPAIMGGDILKARTFFEKSFEKDGAAFLLNKYMYARTYAVAAQNEKLFLDTLEEIISAPQTAEDCAFFDAVAREKASLLKEKKNDYF